MLSGAGGGSIVGGTALIFKAGGADATQGWIFKDHTGVSRLEIKGANGQVYMPGNVGIGVTAPTARLHLAAGTLDASSAPLKFTAGDLMTAVENGAMEFNGTDYYLTAGGVRNKIVTGTANLSDFVKIAGDTMSGALIVPAGSAGSPSIAFAGDANTGMFSSGADTLSFSTAGVAKMTITPNGNVGIGTTSPQDLLHIERNSVSGIDPKITLDNLNAGAGSGSSIEFYQRNGGGTRTLSGNIGFRQSTTFGANFSEFFANVGSSSAVMDPNGIFSAPAFQATHNGIGAANVDSSNSNVLVDSVRISAGFS